MSKIDTLEDLPTISEYLKTHSMTIKNFKKAIIEREVSGYPKEVGNVRFEQTTGEILFYGEAPMPDKDTLERMKLELKGANFPQLVRMDTLSDMPNDLRRQSDDVFVFTDFDDKVVMIHERRETEDGKIYLPWTRWSDGKWRMMETDGFLPFYNLKGARSKSTLFIHEGPKPARRLQRMIDGKEEPTWFPWFEQMKHGHHVAWVGGVHAVSRAEWGKLSRLGFNRVVICCDNDDVGMDIAPEISKHFNCRVEMITYRTEDWPLGFDLADDFPEHLWQENEDGSPVYVGPQFEAMLSRSTWATYEYTGLTPSGRETTLYGMHDNWAKEWFWVSEVDGFVHRHNHVGPAIAAGQFDNIMASRRHAKASVAKLMRSKDSCVVQSLTYDPSKAGSLVRTADGRTSVNLFKPCSIVPKKGDVRPFFEFMEYLFPHEAERQHMYKWIITLLAAPHVRMKFGVLLMSITQGTGKTTLGSILSEAVGMHNSSAPGESMIVNSEFNQWMAEKRFVLVNEIYSGHSWKAYNSLKTYVSDETVQINIKHEKLYTIPNWTHFMLCSNDKTALKIENKDRRWLIPEVTEAKWPKKKFKALYRWRSNGGIAALLFWAQEAVAMLGHYTAGDESPMTDSKQALIDESRDADDQMVHDLVEAMKEDKNLVCIDPTSVREWILESPHGRGYVMQPNKIASRMEQLGLFRTKRIKFDRLKRVVMTNNEEALSIDPNELRAAMVQPKDYMGEEDY